MNRDDTLLQRLVHQLGPWLGVIQRGVGASAVACTRCPEGIVISVLWEKPTRTYEKTFPKERLFGRTFTLSVEAHEVEQRPCDYAKEALREILEHRGVL
jgi:hypothetical protein